MANEEHNLRQNHTATDGKSAKKVKNNKVPQRGMGVAQLEKIIIEKQLKDAGVLPPNSVKFQRPGIPLPQPFPPNRHPLISSSGGGNGWSRLYNFNGWSQQPCSSSMVNMSLGTTSSTSVMNMKIEHPSIQSYSGNKYPSFNQDGDKMVGMKRPYPFSMENIPPAYVSQISKPDESTPFRRENPSSLGPTNDQKTKNFMEENLNLTRDFLTLAPPQSSTPSHSRLEEKLLPSYQGQTRDTSETEWSNKQPLHSFFPAVKTDDGTSNGEVVEDVDLNLKL